MAGYYDGTIEYGEINDIPELQKLLEQDDVQRSLYKDYFTPTEFYEFMTKHGYRTVGDSTDLDRTWYSPMAQQAIDRNRIVNGNQAIFCRAYTDPVTEETQLIAETLPAVTTDAGTSITAGGMLSETNPTVLGLSVLNATGVGWDILADTATIAKISDSLYSAFNDGKSIKDPEHFGNNAHMMTRIGADGRLRTYAEVSDVKKCVQALFENGAYNGKGSFVPSYTQSGYYTLTGGGCNPNMALSFARNASEETKTRFIGECQNVVNHAGIMPNACTIRWYPNHLNDWVIVDMAMYALDNEPYLVTIGTDTDTVNCGRSCIGRASFQCKISDGSWLATGHDYDTPDWANTVRGQVGLYSYYSTVGAEYGEPLPELIYNDLCTTITNPNQFDSVFADWVRDGFTVGAYNPQTKENELKTYIPVEVQDIFGTDKQKDITPDIQGHSQSGKIPLNENFPDMFPSFFTGFINGSINYPTINNTPELPEGETPVPPVVDNNTSNKLYTVYNPTNAELDSLGGYLWDATVLERISKMFSNNPLDAVISLHQVYVTPSTQGRHDIILGNCDSDVPADIVNKQYVTIDCGTITIPELFADARDYLNVDCQVYLPFISFRSIDVHDVVGCSVNIKYVIDVYTGSCLAQLNITKDNRTNTLYTFEGNCSVQIPLTSSDRSRILGTIASACGSFITGTVLSGGNIGVGLASTAVSGSVSALNGGAQSTIQRTSGFSGNCGAMAIKKPYIVITRLKSADAMNYNNIVGVPTNKTVYLKDKNGYTRVKEIHLDNLNCTDYEKGMIESILKNGIEL